MGKSIAVIGTGIMGSGIAANFLKAGYEVTVWNRSPEKTADLQTKGAKLAATPKEATAASEIVFEVTANDESSRSIWLGPGGILAGANHNKILVASATLTVQWIEELAALCAKNGLNFFDMPLTGGRVAAEGGSLTLLVGGDEPKLETIKLDLVAISSKILYFGPAGSGMKYKLVLNGLQAAHLVAFGEAMKQAKKAGLAVDKVGSALVDRPGGVITEIAWDSYQESEIPLTFSINWIAKDLEYLRQMSKDIKVPILEDVLAAYKALQAAGYGDQDWAFVNQNIK